MSKFLQQHNNYYSLLDKYGIFILCLFGSLIRIIYGYLYEPWNGAPDHLAWELVIEQGSLDYSHLIHYPHEGGSILISLFTLLFRQISSISALSISAVIFDFFIRFLQISIIKKVINPRTAYVFGLWTIFASPILLPWGTLSFGLHYISSVFPFLLASLVFQNKNSAKYQLFCGAFLGLAFWFSYSNIVLIPVFFLYCIVGKVEFKNWIYSLISLAFILLCHTGVRIFMDSGFHLNKFNLFSIRGELLSFSEINFGDKLSNIPNSIANSQIGLPQPDSISGLIKPIFYLYCVLSGIGLFLAYKKKQAARNSYIFVLIILSFLIAYILSPFLREESYGNHIVLRHLTYIAPLIASVMIWGLLSLKPKFFIFAFLLLGITQSGRLFQAETTTKGEIITKATGWVLATKLGHSPTTIHPIIMDNPKKRKLLLQGIGWGISTSLMSDAHSLSAAEIDTKVNQMVNLLASYPDSYQQFLFEGVQFSFSDQVTPRLDEGLLIKIKACYHTKFNSKTI